jgi:hypothetical protein
MIDMRAKRQDKPDRENMEARTRVAAAFSFKARRIMDRELTGHERSALSPVAARDATHRAQPRADRGGTTMNIDP